jgi:diaminohydroxyphosphoribosylaminopyrimidine deaminase/5-amino-6-(5-phosphoribosylamino)uracil reductase
VTPDERFMGLALDLARRSAGRTAPNPNVGCVVVAHGRVLAEGWTQPPGQHHAEPHALAALGGRAEGATMYVTLEPCCHHGRTPPCTDAILAAGVRRVVVGTGDPFPLVAGRGLARLREAGVEVVVGVREAECRRTMLGFLRAVTAGLPEVTIKAAITLDGRIASAAGESRWITGAAARDAGHRLRDTHDAVLIGVGTVLADDPALTTRLAGGRDAVPVVLDTSLRTPRGAAVIRSRPALVFAAPDAVGQLPAEIVRVPRAAGGLDLAAVLRVLAGRGLHRVLAEGGGRVHRALVDGGFVDRIELFINGRVLGGGAGFVAGPGFALAEAPAFRFASAEQVGEDLHVALEAG